MLAGVIDMVAPTGGASIAMADRSAVVATVRSRSLGM
jgi:hypothetical protein